MPNEFFRKIYFDINKEYKIAIALTVFFTLCTHLFIFTNRIPNHDSLHSLYHNQAILWSGRFTLGPVASISSYFDLPWVIGLIAALYLSIFVVLIIALFNIKSYLAIFLISSLVSSFPVLGSTFTYLYTADAYVLGYALSIFAIYCVVKRKNGYIYSWIFLLVAIGIYQATLSVFLVFSTLILIIELVFKNVKYKDFLRLTRRLLITLISSLGVYTVVFKVYQKYKGITNYQGLNEAGNIGIDVLKNGIYNSYAYFIDFYFRGFRSNFEINLFEILNVFVFIICFIALARILINSSIRLVNRITAIILVILIPIFSFVMFFISPTVEYHMLMKFSLVAIYVSVAFVYSEYLEKNKKIVLSWVVTIVLFLSFGNNLIINNIAYLNAEMKYERSLALVNRVLVKAEDLENYQDANKIMVVGKPKMWTKISNEVVRNNIPVMIGAVGEHIMNSQSRFRNMMEYYFGVYLIEVSNTQGEQIRNSIEFKEMQTWPTNESVRVIDDVLVIRFD